MKASVQHGCVPPLLREGETEVLLVLEQASGLPPVEWAVSCHGLSLGCPRPGDASRFLSGEGALECSASCCGSQFHPSFLFLDHLFDDKLLLLPLENCGSVCGVHRDFSGLTFQSECSACSVIIEKEFVLVWGR